MPQGQGGAKLWLTVNAESTGTRRVAVRAEVVM
jgi:hypothetical protein